MLAAGDSASTILEGYPWLEPEDIQACLVYSQVVGEGFFMKELEVAFQDKLLDTLHVTLQYAEAEFLEGFPYACRWRTRQVSFAGLIRRAWSQRDAYPLSDHRHDGAAGKLVRIALDRFFHPGSDFLKVVLLHKWAIHESAHPVLRVMEKHIFRNPRTGAEPARRA